MGEKYWTSIFKFINNAITSIPFGFIVFMSERNEYQAAAAWMLMMVIIHLKDLIEKKK